MTENANIEFLGKLYALQDKYSKVTTNSERFYIIRRIADLCDKLIEGGFDRVQLEQIKSRLLKIWSYGKSYDYSLAENLREQKIIIADSIQSSPMHLKKVELQNTAIINYPEQGG